MVQSRRRIEFDQNGTIIELVEIIIKTPHSREAFFFSDFLESYLNNGLSIHEFVQLGMW